MKPDCSHQEIRDAFVKLSKQVKLVFNSHSTHSDHSSLLQLHPDGNQGDSKEFGKVMEAYKVLSKEETRASYDYEQSGATTSFGGNHMNYGQSINSNR